jgi:hypothetical protein
MRHVYKLFMRTPAIDEIQSARAGNFAQKKVRAHPEPATLTVAKVHVQMLQSA